MSGGAKTVIYGSKCGTLPKASRKGYTFEGWYTKASGGSQISADTTFGNDSNTTVYARWKKVKVSRAVVKKVSNVKGRKMAVTVKKASGADGYYIEYSTSKKFTKKTTKRTSVKATSKSTVKRRSEVEEGEEILCKSKSYKLDSTGKRCMVKTAKQKTVTVKK